MKTKRKSTPSTRLGAYLTAGVGIGCLASNSNAAIQIIDISAFSGPNGGVSSSDYQAFNFAGVAYGLEIYNGYESLWGLDGDNGVSFAVNTDDFAQIRKFSSGETIGSAALFDDYIDYTAFKRRSKEAPDFGPNSFVGFEANGKYGWLEVTWNGSTDTFNIIAAAYQDSGASIAAGDLTAVPEPTSVLSTMGLLASGLMLRRRKLAA
jgi:hypothetical protein